MGDELGKILKMIESGVITSEDGQALIKVIDTAHRKVNEVNQGMTGRFLHINVDSHDKEEEVIEINIPLNLARSVLKMGFIQKQIKAQTRTGIGNPENTVWKPSSHIPAVISNLWSFPVALTSGISISVN